MNLFGTTGQQRREWLEGILSRFARFDPRLAHLRNLSAGLAGTGILAPVLMQDDQQ